MAHFVLLLKLSEQMASTQSVLNFDGWDGHPQFETSMVCVLLIVIYPECTRLCISHTSYSSRQKQKQSLGRVALIASILCTFLGMHLMLCLQLTLHHFGIIPSNTLNTFPFWTDDTMQMAFQWTIYVIFLCTFHLGEFFTTAIFNPAVCTGDSFMVNHSKAYTTAALVSS